MRTNFRIGRRLIVLISPAGPRSFFARKIALSRAMNAARRDVVKSAEQKKMKTKRSLARARAQIEFIRRQYLGGRVVTRYGRIAVN